MMKVILLTALIFCAMSLSAQSVWHFGLEAGSNLGVSSVKLNSSDNKLEAASRIGFEGGGFVELSPGRSDNFFKLQADVLYSNINVNYPMQTVGVGIQSGKIMLRQINVPLTAKFFIKRNLSLNAGPTFNFNTGGKYILSEEDNTRFTVDLNNERLKSFNLGMIAGCTYYFQNRFFANISYSPLFGSINKNESGTGSFEDLNGKIKWGSFSLKVGIRF